MIAIGISFDKKYYFMKRWTNARLCAIICPRTFGRNGCTMKKDTIRIIVIVLCAIIVLGIIAMPLSMLAG